MSTGRDLRYEDSRLVFNVGYAVLVDNMTLMKEQVEAIEKVDKILDDRVFEGETGLPAIAQTVPSADEMYGPRDEHGNPVDAPPHDPLASPDDPDVRR